MQAVDKDPSERPALLDAACADLVVRSRVEALLKAHDTAGDFLDCPAFRPTLPDGPDSRVPGGDPSPAGELPDFLDRCDAPGRIGRLAHYEILDVLGRGGMGIVMRGVDVRLDRVVAIKVLAPHLAADAGARTRVLREARAAAAVSHPHVVAIHGVDEAKGLPYMVMECVTGPSLQQKIEGGALPVVQVLRIGVQVAAGLAAAHAQGLVHRDIKPANILLENGVERVKITDFGLARAVDDVQITREGAVYGTPLYMSPEQATGGRMDQRTDLFSLGSVMYAMCTGRPPFRAETGLAVLRRVCDDTPRPIRDLNPDIPQALAEIGDRLLAKHPDDRFQSAGELAEVLGRYLVHMQHDPLAPFLDGEDSRPRPARYGRRHRPLAVGVAALLAAIAAVAMVEGTRAINRAGPAAPGGATAGPEAPAASKTLPVARGKSAAHAPPARDRPVKVFILAGDSNMAGRAQSRLLKSNQARTQEHFRHLVRDRGWAVRDDVWIKYLDRKGNLTVSFGDTPERIGPELEFGRVVGDQFDEQVLLIKTCWGGHRLGVEFRSPAWARPPAVSRRRSGRSCDERTPMPPSPTPRLAAAPCTGTC